MFMAFLDPILANPWGVGMVLNTALLLPAAIAPKKLLTPGALPMPGPWA